MGVMKIGNKKPQVTKKFPLYLKLFLQATLKTQTKKKRDVAEVVMEDPAENPGRTYSDRKTFSDRIHYDRKMTHFPAVPCSDRTLAPTVL